MLHTNSLQWEMKSQYTSLQLVDIGVMQVRLKILDVYQSNAGWS